MKFFGWGRKKDPPPTRHDEVKISDAGASARSIRDPRITEWGSGDPELLSKDHWFEGEMAAQVAWEDRLQETIRFVFSHEQEGLLAIGTFALDQLAGACLGHDMIKSPATTTTTTTTTSSTTSTTTTDRRSCNNSSTSVSSSMQVVLRELRSSDVDDSVSELFSPCKRKDLPVFGDHDELHPVVDTTIQLLPIHVLKHSATGPNSPDLADAEGLATQNSTGVQQFHVPRVVSSTTEHEEFYESRGGCGIFGSGSRQTKKPGQKEKRKKLPPEKKNNSELNFVKKADRSKGFRTSLARLWRPGCNGPPAEVTPEPDLQYSPRESSQMQVPGVPCIANVELELPVLPKPCPSQPLQKASECGERKRRGPSFAKGTWACARNGKWIRTDSEFVVLEM